MKFKLGLIILVLLIVPFAVHAQGADICPVVTLLDGYARATVEGAPTSAAYGFLINLSDEADTLISASTDAADAVELHEILMGEGDVMQMRPVEGGIPVGARGVTVLEPGGLHIMLIGLHAPLVAGETLDLTLEFEHAGEVVVTIPIRDPMMEMDHDMSMGG